MHTKISQRGFVGLELLVFTGLLMGSIIISVLTVRNSSSVVDTRTQAACAANEIFCGGCINGCRTNTKTCNTWINQECNTNTECAGNGVSFGNRKCCPGLVPCFNGRCGTSCNAPVTNAPQAPSASGQSSPAPTPTRCPAGYQCFTNDDITSINLQVFRTYNPCRENQQCARARIIPTATPTKSIVQASRDQKKIECENQKMCVSITDPARCISVGSEDFLNRVKVECYVYGADLVWKPKNSEPSPTIIPDPTRQPTSTPNPTNSPMPRPSIPPTVTPSIRPNPTSSKPISIDPAALGDLNRPFFVTPTIQTIVSPSRVHSPTPRTSLPVIPTVTRTPDPNTIQLYQQVFQNIVNTAKTFINVLTRTTPPTPSSIIQQTQSNSEQTQTFGTVMQQPIAAPVLQHESQANNIDFASLTLDNKFNVEVIEGENSSLNLYAECNTDPSCVAIINGDYFESDGTLNGPSNINGVWRSRQTNDSQSHTVVINNTGSAEIVNYCDARNSKNNCIANGNLIGTQPTALTQRTDVVAAFSGYPLIMEKGSFV